MSQQITSDENSSVLKLEGTLTVADSTEIKDVFNELYNNGNNISVDHSSALSFDFSYLQLLHAFKMKCQHTGKNFSMVGAAPQEFLNLVSDSGFANMI